MRIEELEEEVGSLKVQAVVRQGSSAGMLSLQKAHLTGYYSTINSTCRDLVVATYFTDAGKEDMLLVST